MCIAERFGEPTQRIYIYIVKLTQKRVRNGFRSLFLKRKLLKVIRELHARVCVSPDFWFIKLVSEEKVSLETSVLCTAHVLRRHIYIYIGHILDDSFITYSLRIRQNSSVFERKTNDYYYDGSTTPRRTCVEYFDNADRPRRFFSESLLISKRTTRRFVRVRLFSRVYDQTVFSLPNNKRVGTLIRLFDARRDVVRPPTKRTGQR